MGCGTVKEKLEYQIMVLKVEKLDILQEKLERMKDLEKITGKPVIRKPIPNYMNKKEDSNEEGNDSNDDKKTEHSTMKKSNASSKKQKKKNDNKREEEE